MMELDQPREIIKELIKTQYFAVLSTLGDGRPYSNLVSFAVTDDLKTLIFITGRNTRKFRNIRQNGNISLLIDNRTNRPSDIAQAIAVTAIGTAQEQKDKEDSLKSIFLARHPQLRHFVDAPDNAFIVVTLREYIIAQFDKTQRLTLS